MTDTTYAAAWVPDDDPARSLDVAAELAVLWVLRQAEALHVTPVLVTQTKEQWTLGPDAIRRLATTSDTVTDRGSRPSGDRRAVLAYLPRYRDMYRAVPYARGGALAVVEYRADPLSGWAMETQAVNLVDGQLTPKTWNPGQQNLLEDIHTYGNNGWTRGPDADHAARLVQELVADGVASDTILGFMVARHHSEEAIERLAAIIKRVV
ncbi:hypothetical protein NC315_37175 [Streptomyces sp. G2]|uniref:hypothetical protein n=1 Tax=Streptomyces sp. G2 TaxID=1684471 RepID=UPI002030D8D3|nr:hypothetical protein [Streptomyces sp. G2]MCM1950953.1 hypothetical protein [Streptomyces sp. G2]